MSDILLVAWPLIAALASVLAQAGFGTAFGSLAHFAPFYLSAAGPMVLAVLRKTMPWRRTVIAAAAVALVGSGLLIVPELVRSTGPKATSQAGGQIKVIQLNGSRANADVGRVADWLIAQRPDVVTLSEARHDLRDLLVRRAGWKVAGGAGSLMIFTPQRYVAMDRQRALRGPPPEFVNATYANPSGPIEVVTTHLNRRLGPSVGRQIVALEGVAGGRPRTRMILTGDFNATPWSAEIRRLDGSLDLVRRDRAVASWPAQVFGVRWPFPFLPIDHVYAGRGWATVSVERGPWLGSDHYPVIVTLAPVSAR